MKLKVNIAIVSTLLFFAACTNSSEPADNNKENAKRETMHDGDVEKHTTNANNEHAEEHHILTLNGDEKWEANTATEIGMTKIKDILSTVNQEGNTIEQYRKLGEKLTKQTDNIINKCDMTGEAHSQLHIVLSEILTNISKLKEVESPEAGKTYVSDLNEDIKTYFSYFKSE